jgi:predicted phosphodiesterase
MRLRILSDLHCEFHHDEGKDFMSFQHDDDYDVIVIAGDLTLATMASKTFMHIQNAAQGRQIVYVLGNHEYYRSTPTEARDLLKNIEKSIKNLHVLDDNFVVIDNVRFVGSTLWFEHSGEHEQFDKNLSDFSAIKGFRPWIGTKSKVCKSFIWDNVRERDVVVTHHMPHALSIHQCYKGSLLNRYFIHDVTNVVENRNAQLWIHGHTHSSVDYRVGTTRVVCNPYGYRGNGENSQFNYRFTVDVK